MKFWIYKESESDNVLIMDENSLTLGSTDRDNIKMAEAHLASGKSASDVLGSDDLTVVPFIQIQSISNRDTDLNLSVAYKAKKEIKHLDYYFNDANEANACLEQLNAALPPNLKRKETQQSSLSAALWPLISLAMCSGVSYLFFDKLRIAVYIVGGLWAAFSLFNLYRRISNPPKLTTWVIKGKHVRKAWNGLKMAGAYAVAGVFALGLSASFPDAYGEKSLYTQMEEQFYEETFTVEDVQKFVSRGADLNYTDGDGYNSLMMALDWSHYDIAEALVEAGADLGPAEGDSTSMLEYALYDGAPDSVIQKILDNGGLDAAMKTGFDIEEYVEYSGNDSVYALIDD